ncbi:MULTISPECIES: type IV pilin protein [unclassified Fibrobacter]|uniref:type IV pilin protein n=1 Tax=unclassified Fibrobacter TaxID=2634177 RepID=UPI000D7AF80D|nr:MULTISPECIES: type II secretion system protein [unclassified Fibrobacter]PWJ59772.1 prepilin-type N-terminal cleavage/methylation domain-containing protein [Fibrobacter sp. UWR4]PZW68038.1 prepilin-type N-terminal cleavage/methylation domain-containing protein [Fibrobacter sp. UWR1]
MRKQGFTLVELMVVITIMGILSSVVVPKVAGAVVKARASEISPAAMTYTKLQSAYLYEHKAFGSWKKIGYQSPGGKKGRTDTFKYSKGDVTTSIRGRNVGSTLKGEGKVAWLAENRVGLGKCHVGNQWQIRVVATSDTEIEYRPEIVQSKTSSSCVSLAKDWGNFDLQASLVTAPSNYAGHEPSSSGSAIPGGPASPETPGDEIIVAGGNPPAGPSGGETPSSSTASSSSAILVASKFVDEDEKWEEEDDGSCGVMYTSAGNRCPPSWCKLNGNVARNHGGWSNDGHKWNECYVARQELISEAAEQGLVTCKNEKNCKVSKTSKGSTITINGNKISVADEEDDSESETPVTYSGKGRVNAEKALGDKVMCAEDKNDNACSSWRLARECPYPNKEYTQCSSWNI